jgi:hypothetical protein
MFKQRYPHITTLAAYGCSFTAGAELGDHLLHPKAEGIKRKKGFDNWWNNVVANADHELKRKWWDAEQAGAWPKLSADLMDLDVVNNARGGTALGSAVWQFEEDILLGRLDPKTTLFVFGVTNVPRIKMFKPSPINTLRIGNPTGKPRYWCDRTITDIVTDGYMLWNHLQLLERIYMLAQRQDLKLAAFNMFAPLHPTQYDTIIREDLPLFKYQYDRLNTLPGFFLEEPSMSNFIREGEQLGLGHPNHAVHARFAQHVVNCLDRL